MTPRKAALIAAVAQWVIRAILGTLRFRIVDRAGIMAQPSMPPVLWAFWHNRLFVVPYLFEHFASARPGAALTSPSKDGELLAAVLSCFGIQPIRGSSSRRGAVAWREMRRAADSGSDVAITPDGPRGPRYHVNPGLVLLAQKTHVPVMPVRVVYSRAIHLKSWDGFMIPLPFARVDVVFDTPIDFGAVKDNAGFESERVRLETVLREGISEADQQPLEKSRKAAIG
jgi:lysophospholipid acyltransferase (LPLAT)-like uncharacterized protein